MILGASQGDLLFVYALLKDESLPYLSLLLKLRLKSVDLLIKILDFVIKAMLLNVLILSVIVDLLVDLLINLLNLLPLFFHLSLVLVDTNPLIVQSLFLFIDGQLFCVLVSVHFGTLRGSNFIKPGSRLGHNTVQLDILIALPGLQTAPILI